MVAAVAPTVEEIHASSKVVEVEVSKLRVDTSYQRDFSETLVDEIANDFDSVAAELITVSDRGPRTNDPNGVEGGLWVVNGQHRSKGAQKAGRKTIWARLIDLRKVDDPAAIEARFRLKTNRKLSDRPLERFKAQLRSFDEESLAIVAILARYGTEINLKASPETGVNCVVTVEQLYRMDQGVLLGETLEVVRDTFDRVSGQTASSSLLKGIGWFIEKHANETDRDRLVAKMKGLGVTSLSARAHSTGLTHGGSLWVNYYRVIVDLYNEQLREKNRLNWALRGKSALSKGGGSNTAA